MQNKKPTMTKTSIVKMNFKLTEYFFKTNKAKKNPKINSMLYVERKILKKGLLVQFIDCNGEKLNKSIAENQIVIK